MSGLRTEFIAPASAPEVLTYLTRHYGRPGRTSQELPPADCLGEEPARLYLWEVPGLFISYTTYVVEYEEADKYIYGATAQGTCHQRNGTLEIEMDTSRRDYMDSLARTRERLLRGMAPRIRR